MLLLFEANETLEDAIRVSSLKNETLNVVAE
jgi:hypothetical protein